MARRYFKFTEAARMARRDYLMQWRKNNPDKVREYNRRYWERRAAANETGKRVSCIDDRFNGHADG